jgi:hypothetical protein
MSTAVSNYDTEKRSRAAKMGWAMRRPVEDTPERPVSRRVHTLTRTIDPRIGRLFNCDKAASILHFYTEERPEDTLPAKALAVARKYADGVRTGDLVLVRDGSDRPEMVNAALPACERASAKFMMLASPRQMPR